MKIAKSSSVIATRQTKLRLTIKVPKEKFIGEETVANKKYKQDEIESRCFCRKLKMRESNAVHGEPRKVKRRLNIDHDFRRMMLPSLVSRTTALNRFHGVKKFVN